MVSITLSVPPELKKRMDAHTEMNWSEQIRAIVRKQLDALEEMERIASMSKLTENDVEELAARVDRGIAKRLKAMESATRG